MQNLRNEIEDLKQRLSDAENAGTQALIALEVEKARNKESLKQNQEWRDTQLAKAHDAAERNQHRENVEAMEKRIREETDTLQKKLQGQIDRVRELENELVLSESQFARAIADSEAASSRANSKDKDMTELMKSIKDIQDAAHLREEEANKHRRSAEKKKAELNTAVSQLTLEKELRSRSEQKERE